MKEQRRGEGQGREKKKRGENQRKEKKKMRREN
jgi:hypothetical protein